MKHTIKYIPILVALALCSCGDKKAEDASSSSSSESPTGSTATQSAPIGTPATVKSALKSKVNGVSADLMTSVVGYLDVAPAKYEIPSDLAERELVQVTVTWPLKAKYDLYSYESQLSELPNKPVVIEKHYSKGEVIDSVKAMYILASDQAGGYILQKYRQDKNAADIEAPDLSGLEALGKHTLLKGSDEHLAASKEVAAIKSKKDAEQKKQALKKKQEAEEKLRKKLEQYVAVITPGSVFHGGFVGRGGKKDPFNFKIDSVEKKAGETYFKLTVVELNRNPDKPAYHAIYSGKQNPETGVLSFEIVRPSRSSLGWAFMDRSTCILNFLLTEHKEKVTIDIKKRDDESYSIKSDFLLK